MTTVVSQKISSLIRRNVKTCLSLMALFFHVSLSALKFVGFRRANVVCASKRFEGIAKICAYCSKSICGHSKSIRIYLVTLSGFQNKKQKSDESHRGSRVIFHKAPTEICEIIRFQLPFRLMIVLLCKLSFLFCIRCSLYDNTISRIC